MTKTEKMNMHTYISTIKELARRLCNLGSEISDKEMIVVITCGLPESYDSLIIMLDALPVDELTLAGVSKWLLNEEACLVIGPGPKNSALKAEAILVSAGTRGQKICYIRKFDHVL
jgi:hypothetical protein